MRKFIFTESQIKNILDELIKEENQISEQRVKVSGKFTFAPDKKQSGFNGEIKKDGYLYITTEIEGRHFKVGPLSKVPKIGQSILTIDKKGPIEKVYFGKTLLQFVPNFTVKQIG